MVDKSCDDETEQAIARVIEEEKGVEALVSLQTRMFGSRVYADVVIAVNGNISLTEAHEIAEKVHDDIESNFPSVKHCMVHIDPAEE